MRLLPAALLLLVVACGSMPGGLGNADVTADAPLRVDTDQDGIDDDLDYCLDTPFGLDVNQGGCALSQLDRDGDGFSDDDEMHGIPGTDPLDPTDNPENVRDSDRDGCSDYDEMHFRGYCDNDPNSPVDTDGDGLLDSEEILVGTSPTLADTDGDGLTDGEEVAMDFDPLTVDGDSDGLDDYDEWFYGTDPYHPDTDSDLLRDGDEVHIHGTDPLEQDTDHDGVMDGLELKEPWESDPLNPDTDGDGFLDGEEIPLGLDILEYNPTGVVLEVYCDDYFLAQSGDVTGVFGRDILSPSIGFQSGFRPGDTVAFLPHGIADAQIGATVVNVRTREHGYAAWLGVCPSNKKRVHERMLSCSKTRYLMPKVPSECCPSNDNRITRTGS